MAHTNASESKSTNPMSALAEAPWRAFFPLGTLGLMFGIGCWWIGFPAPPILWHPELMISGFLLPVGTGFLCYTLPRFFSSHRVRLWEVGLLLVLEVTLLCAALLAHALGVAVLKTATLLLLSYFALSRFPRERHAPTFAIFICAGILLGLLGALSQLAGVQQAYPLEPEVAAALGRLHRSAYYHGFFWLLLAGMGTRLFPMLTLSIRAPGGGRWKNTLAYSRSVWYPLCLLLCASFLLPWQAWAQWSRTLAFWFVAWQGWLLFRPATRRGPVPRYVKLAGGLILLGDTLSAAFPDQAMALRHLALGGGFGLATLLVMTRVLLAHEGAPLVHETRSRILDLAFGLITAAILGRGLALSPSYFELQIKTGALLMLLGVGVWIVQMVLWLAGSPQESGPGSDENPQSNP